MKVQRHLAPAAAPLSLIDLWSGIQGVAMGEVAHERLEKDFKRQFNSPYVYMVSSGKAALTLLLQALSSLTGRSDVVIPAYTCFSVPAAIQRAGLRVLLCDIDSATLDFNFERLEQIVSPRTLCVIPTHMFGRPAEVQKARVICRLHDAFVVEDAAQGMGIEHFGIRLGTLGDASIFSFGRGKNVTCGGGGAILTRSKRIARAIEPYYGAIGRPNRLSEVNDLIQLTLMTCFIRPCLYWLPAGLPFLKLGETRYYTDFETKQLSGARAGALQYWKVRLAEANNVRAHASSFYRKRLPPTVELTDVPYIRFPFLMPDQESRNRVYARAVKKGLGVSRMYPSAIHEISEIKEQFIEEQYPAASHVAKCVLSLPTHQFVTEEQMNHICNIILEEMTHL